MDNQSTWVQCPECEHVFAVNDAACQVVKQASLVDRPSQSTSDGDLTVSSPATAEGPKFSSATLSAFIGETPSSGAPTDDSSAMAEFQSLDYLVQRGRDGLHALKSPDEARTDEASGAAAAGADLREPQGNKGTSSDALGEPSPEADRMRAPLSEFHPSVSDSASEIADSSSYDAVEDEMDTSVAGDQATDKPDSMPGLDDILSPSSLESTLQDRGDLGDTEVTPAVDGPVFDFHVDDTHAPRDATSLRESMGLGGDQALEVEPPADLPNFDNLQSTDDADVAPELHVGGDAPRGTVVARRRSGTWSAVRTLVGIASGGVVGIVAGYLVLLWIFHFIGRTDEPLDLAKYYPDVIKPSTFQVMATPGDTQTTDEPSDLMVAGSDDLIGLDRIDDPKVEQVNLEVPLIEDRPEVTEPPAAPPVVIAGVPSYTAAELQARTANAELIAGDLIADGPIDKRKGSSYAQLAALAEALTFGEGADDVSWKNNARELYPPLFETEENRKIISTIAGYWLTSPKRRHGGIFFCGSLDEGRQQGSVAEYTCTLPTDGGQQLTVLVPKALSVGTAEAANVVVVGAVVDDPALAIEGYTGDAEQAIWARDVLAVDE